MENLSIIDKSKIWGKVIGSYVYSDSNVGIGSVVTGGVTLSHVILTNGADVSVSKSDKVCDAFEDTLPEDPCMKTPE